MVLTHTTNHTYSHPLSTVTLAYFLRYCSPYLNPFATHVLSTDTIASHVDAATGRLHTTRIHLKKSKLPPAVIKLLPSSLTGGGGDKASYILETSVVDMREGWMCTESRNLNFVGVLSVVEKQTYTAPSMGEASGMTDVATTVIYHSRLGDRIRDRFTPQQQAQQQEGGFLHRLGTRGIQRSIESLASTKTQDQLGNSREGMSIILERLRQSGIVGVLEFRGRTRDQDRDTG